MQAQLHLIGIVLALFAVSHAILAFFAFQHNAGKNPARPWVGALAVSSSIMCVSMALSYFAAATGKNYDFIYRLTWQGYLGAPIIYRIILLHSASIDRWRLWLNRAMFVFWGGIFLVVMTTDLICHQPVSLLPYVRFDCPYEIPVRLIGDLTLSWIVLETLRARKNLAAVRRNKSNYFLLGLLAYISGALFSAGGIQNLTGLPLDPGLVGLFSLPWIVLTYYAVTRHRLFSMGLVISKFLSVVSVGLVIAALTAFATKGLDLYLSNPTVSLAIGAFISTCVTFAAQVFRFSFGAFSSVLQKNSYDFGTVIRESSELAVSFMNVDETLKKFSSLMVKTLGVGSAQFYLAQNEAFTLQCTVGKFDAKPAEVPVALKDWLVGQRKCYVKEELELSSDSSQVQQIGVFLSSVRGEIVVPAFFHENLVGYLVLEAKTDREAFSAEDVRLLETAINPIALFIENARLFEESTTDGLTGLYHQKYFKMRLKNEYNRSHRHQQTLGVMIVDVDHFKKINDSFGHLAGDGVLRELARVLKSTFRTEDIVARYGGEEFCVLLIEPIAQRGQDVAERLRHCIEKHVFPGDIAVTVSIGVHVYHPTQGAKSELEVLEKADAALYRAKNSGRNRVVLSEETQVQMVDAPQKRIA